MPSRLHGFQWGGVNRKLFTPRARIDARGETSAFSGTRFWMYCGEQDFLHDTPMCDEMQMAAHGGLNKNADALSQMFAAFEGC